MKKIIYIVGLSHSGSTLLDFLLSHHPEILGLGEVFYFLNKKRSTFEKTELTCSCGGEMSDCYFWSRYKHNESATSESYIDKYRRVLQMSSCLSKDIVVDSSKKLKALRPLRELQENKEMRIKAVF